MAQHITIPVAGMTWERCVEEIRAALAAVPGVQRARVNVGVAAIVYDTTRVHTFELLDAIQCAGYRPVAANTATFAGSARPRCCGGAH